MDNPYSTTGHGRPAHRAFQEGYLEALKAVRDKQIPAEAEKLEQLIKQIEDDLLPSRV